MSKIYESLWLTAYEGEGEGDGTGGDGGEGTGDVITTTTPAAPTSFTQEHVNKLLATEKRKHQQATQKALDELEAIKKRANLTAVERAELEGRIEQMHNEFLTKEELTKKERDKVTRDYEARIAVLGKEKETWQSKYTDSTVVRSITDAAAVGNAYNPVQIVAILRPITRLVEGLNSDGEPTGELVPKVAFSDTDKDGKPVTLELSPSEAVKRMSEMDQFLNLFKGEGIGGLGSTSRAGGKAPDMVTLAKDPQKYRDARKKGMLSK